MSALKPKLYTVPRCGWVGEKVAMIPIRQCVLGGLWQVDSVRGCLPLPRPLPVCHGLRRFPILSVSAGLPRSYSVSNWKAPQVGAVGMRVNMSILNMCVTFRRRRFVTQHRYGVRYIVTRSLHEVNVQVGTKPYVIELNLLQVFFNKMLYWINWIVLLSLEPLAGELEYASVEWSAAGAWVGRVSNV